MYTCTTAPPNCLTPQQAPGFFGFLPSGVLCAHVRSQWIMSSSDRPTGSSRPHMTVPRQCRLCTIFCRLLLLIVYLRVGRTLFFLLSGTVLGCIEAVSSVLGQTCPLHCLCWKVALSPMDYGDCCYCGAACCIKGKISRAGRRLVSRGNQAAGHQPFAEWKDPH